MHSNLSTRSLLTALALLVLVACAYYFFPASLWTGVGKNNNPPPLTVEEKAAVLHSLSKTSAESAGVTPSEAAERQRTLENVAQSSSDSPAAELSDTEKAKILESLQSQ